MPRRTAPFAIAATLALAACGGNDLAALDNALLASETDPAVTSALEDQILVDPGLSQQADALSGRRLGLAMQAQYPIGPEPAESEAPPSIGACGAAFQYGPEWAERLPAQFPLYPGVQVIEAAGADTGGCRARMITFRSDHDWRRVLDWYRGAATQAGYSSDHRQRGGDHVLAGAAARTGASYYLIVTQAAQGSEAALIVGNGQ